jgi:hypothetical protein
MPAVFWTRGSAPDIRFEQTARVRLPILEVAPYGVEGERFWGRSTDPSHPWLTFPISKIQSETQTATIDRLTMALHSLS